MSEKDYSNSFKSIDYYNEHYLIFVYADNIVGFQKGKLIAISYNTINNAQKIHRATIQTEDNYTYNRLVKIYNIDKNEDINIKKDGCIYLLKK